LSLYPDSTRSILTMDKGEKLPPLQLKAVKSDGSIEFPSKNDVLCGRGHIINNHYGNIQYRSLVRAVKLKYLNKKTKRAQKAWIAVCIVQQIRCLIPPGRFLKKESDAWYEIGDERARRKVGQALREDAPDIRIAISLNGIKVPDDLPEQFSPVAPIPSQIPHHSSEITNSRKENESNAKRPSFDVSKLLKITPASLTNNIMLLSTSEQACFQMPKKSNTTSITLPQNINLNQNTEKYVSSTKITIPTIPSLALGNLRPKKDTTLLENGINSISINNMFSSTSRNIEPDLTTSTDINSRNNNMFSSMSGNTKPDLPITTDINPINNDMFSSISGNTEQANMNKSTELKVLSYEKEKSKNFIEMGQQIAISFNNETMPVNMASRNTNCNGNLEVPKNAASFHQMDANINTNTRVNAMNTARVEQATPNARENFALLTSIMDRMTNHTIAAQNARAANNEELVNLHESFLQILSAELDCCHEVSTMMDSKKSY